VVAVANPYSECQELTDILAKVQVYGKFGEYQKLLDNYRTPCIINALTVLGMSNEQISDIKPLFKGGRVSCQSLSALFKRIGVHLVVSMGTDAGVKKVNHYGDTSAEKEYKMCLTDGHYVPLIDTGISKALLDAWLVMAAKSERL
jgi:hypothetical protein